MRIKRDDLKPCPFCGRTDTVEMTETQLEQNLVSYRVVCSRFIGGCGASSGSTIAISTTVDQWNSRKGSDSE